MKVRITLLILTISLLFSNITKADEGMWIPLFLKKYNIEDMKKKGFKLTAEDIYSVNNVSMKDAVMIFGGGCTAELISDQGLLITNHHCGYGQIQEHSTVEHDYLTDGFWAMSKQDELQNPTLSVKFLVRMEDVSITVLNGISDNMTEADRKQKIKANIAVIEAQAIQGTDYIAVVKPFYYGNQYFLFVQEEFKDVRFVGAPPSAIGKFGGDTDNWMWPRHTGDFSLFRIYADKNNKPAKYSPDNVPYKPKKYFPISIKGVKKDDFTMVLGYPGRTQEYLPSFAVEMISQTENPNQIKIRQNIIDIMGAAMNSDAKIRIQYSNKYASVANSWKKWIGENRGLKRLNTIEKKQIIEKRFQNWTNENSNLTTKYGKILPEYKELYQKLTPFQKADSYFFEAIWSLDIIEFAAKVAILQKTKDIEKDKKSLKIYSTNFFKNYNLETDKKLFRKMIELYYFGAGNDFQPDVFNFVSILTNFGFTTSQSLDIYTEHIFNNSIFVNEDKFSNFIENYTQENLPELISDPVFGTYNSFVLLYVSKILPTSQEINDKIDVLNRQYMKGLMEMDSLKVFYPDANFTFRVTYGQVDDYEPNDAVSYKYFTTLKGIIDKDNPDIYDYKVPTKLKDLYITKDYGQYAENGEMHVCFTASNHTTGGNSGSPVINGNGELIGVNFDRNWEGTMSDIMYDPEQCRNITLDIRYALFIIDKFAGAHHLIEEMKIISN